MWQGKRGLGAGVIGEEWARCWYDREEWARCWCDRGRVG